MDGAWRGGWGGGKEMHDVFDGQFLNDFKGQDGHRFG